MATQDIQQRTVLPPNGVGQESYVSRPLTINNYVKLEVINESVPSVTPTTVGPWVLLEDGGLGRAIQLFSDYVRPRPWVNPGHYLIIVNSRWDSIGSAHYINVQNNAALVTACTKSPAGITTGEQSVSGLVTWTNDSGRWLEAIAYHNDAGNRIFNAQMIIIKLA